MVGTISDTEGKTFTGGCHCGGVRFRLTGPLRKVLICHCDDCRKLAGASWSATGVGNENCHFISDETLTWYDSSAWARRGFCNQCGSNLFYHLKGQGALSVATGMLDDASGLAVAGQIFKASHPEWGPVDSQSTPELDDELVVNYVK